MALFSLEGSAVYDIAGLASLLRTFVFLLPLILLLPRWVGAMGVWLAIPLAGAASFVISVG